jgi:hypothetical protein
MDLFKQLDEREAVAPGETTIMVRYRTRFHRDVIYSKYSMNPNKSFEEISASVALNDPARFLPQPWPPLPITDRRSLLIASIAKMKAIVNVGLQAPAGNTALLTQHIDEHFPMRQAIPADTNSVVSCEVRICEQGDVNYNCDHSAAAQYDPSLLVQKNGRHNFMKAMIILSLQNYLESLAPE